MLTSIIIKEPISYYIYSTELMIFLEFYEVSFKYSVLFSNKLDIICFTISFCMNIKEIVCVIKKDPWEQEP